MLLSKTWICERKAAQKKKIVYMEQQQEQQQNRHRFFCFIFVMQKIRCTMSSEFMSRSN